MSWTIDTTYLTQTLIELVQIDSRNPSLTPGCPGEAAAGAYVAEAMQQMGLQVKTHELASDRVNVVGILKGSGGGRALLLNAHLDTVGTEGMADPFSGELRDGRVYGRGSQDMKGSIAAMLATAKALVDHKIALAGDLLLTFVADEEAESIGMQDLVKHYTADGAIVTEPTDMAIGLAHRGFIWYEVETTGRAAHGSRFQEGIDANMHMGRFLAELDKLEQEIRQRPPHPLTGPPSLHASLLQGGSELSVYAAKCRLQMERRTAPGESEADTRQELQSLIDRLAAADASFQATVKPLLERPTFELNADAKIVRAATAATARRLGQPATHIGTPFWTDAALLAKAGIDALLLGPRGEGLHSAEEWVDLDALVDLAHIMTDIAIDFSG